MSDPILDDVQALLEKELGDKRILEQILRAAQNNEVISNFERNYVRKLAEKHLGKKPPIEKKISDLPKQTSPDVVIPPSSPMVKPQTVQTYTSSPKITKSNSKNIQIMLGIGVVALIAIVITAISLGDISDSSSIGSPSQSPTSSKPFSVQTDSSSYQKGDIISISGKSILSLGNQISLSIENSENELVWTEQVTVKRDGLFSTLTFAGGSGWEKTGTFTIKAESDSEETISTFSFTG